MRTRPILAVLLVGTALLGCVPRADPPQPAPSVAVTPPPPPPPRPAPLVGDWSDWPLTPGTWTYRRDARGSLALFGPAGTDARLTLRCDTAARRLYLSVNGTAATPLTIRTTSLTRALPVQPTGGTPAYVAAALAPRDPLLDAMAFSRGRFTVEQARRAPIVAPAWAEIGRVTEDCRA